MFTATTRSLKTLLNEVASGKIQLPDFQRGWVWGDDRIRGLLASISRSFPVGAVMTLSSGGDINFKTRLIEGVGENGVATAVGSPDSFLLDGQQRLTSLYQALLHPGPVVTEDSRGEEVKRWYYIDMLKAMDSGTDREEAIISVPEDKKITRHFGRETVLDLSTLELEYQNHMIPTEQLFKGTRWILSYNKAWVNNGEHPSGDLAAFIENFEESVLNAFNEYVLPVINLEKGTSKEAVCTVFEKVNTGGITLTVFELATASFAADAGGEHFSLREDWDERRNRLNEKVNILQGRSGVLRGVEGDHFLQVVALLTTQERRRKALRENKESNQPPAISCSRRAILELHLNDYKRWADKVEEGFIAAANFLNSQYVFTRWDVPYNTQLVPLAALYVELDKELEPANARARLEWWYWSGIFGEAYGSNTETQYALDLQEVAAYVRGENEPRLMTEANFVPERLLSLRTRNSAAYKGLYALQMKSGAADWRTGKTLDMSVWHNENIDIHHIFPVYWCENNDDPSDKNSRVPASLYQSVINKTPIDARTNRIIGGNAPSVYLPRLLKALQPEITREIFDGLLKSHWINPNCLWADTLPEGGGSAKGDDFAKFFVERGEEMLTLILKAMGKPLVSGREVFQAALRSEGLLKSVEETASAPVNGTEGQTAA